MNLSKLKAFFEHKNNKMKGIVVLGLLGMLLILLSEVIPSFTGKKSEKSQAPAESAVSSVTTYKEQAENALSAIISKIDGVGKCAVMITFETSAENVYAYNSTSEYGEKNEKREYNYVIIEDQNKQEPIVVKEIQPKVKGVIVVCEGGENSKVQAAVIDSVTSAFGIASNKISISKMAIKE